MDYLSHFKCLSPTHILIPYWISSSGDGEVSLDISENATCSSINNWYLWRDMTWHHFDGTVMVEVSKTLLAWVVSLQSFHFDSFGRQTSTATVNYYGACHTCKTAWVTLCRHWRKLFVGPRWKWDLHITQHFFSTAVHTPAFIYLHTLQVICNILLDLNVVPHGCCPVCSTSNRE